jgi:hypothetical protein
MMICVSLAAEYCVNRVAGTPGLVQKRRLRASSAPRKCSGGGRDAFREAGARPDPTPPSRSRSMDSLTDGPADQRLLQCATLIGNRILTRGD